MANPNSWLQIPTSVLDLGQRTADAEAWATAQRAKVAETWANTQRQAVSTMATTWQQGMDSVDHFADGFGGSATDPQQGQMGPLGYNDMAGADTSPQGPLSSLRGQPEGIQAAGTAGTQLLPGATPLTDIPGNVRDAAVNQVNNTADQYNYAFKPTLGTRADQPARAQVIGGAKPLSRFTPEQLQGQQEQVGNAVLGVAGEDVAKVAGGLDDAAKAALRKVPLSGYRPTGDAGPMVSSASPRRMYHGTSGAFDVPDPSKFKGDGLYGPGYYLTSLPEIASKYAGEGRAPVSKQISNTGLSPSLERLTLHKQILEDTIRINTKDGLPESMIARQRAELADTNDAIRQFNNPPGPNVRAVNVSRNLKLFDVRERIPFTQEQDIARKVDFAFGSDVHDTFVTAMDNAHPDPVTKATGEDVYRALTHALEGSKARVNRFLVSQGYDGIAHTGGLLTPIRDSGGNPVTHEVNVIFPESMHKLTNAISGTKFGSSPAIGGALAGGYAGSQQGDTPEERARNAVLGAAGGALVGGALAHPKVQGQIGRLARDESGAIGAQPPDTVRMYRGEPNLENRATSSDTSRVGRWFTPDINEAHQYGRDTYGDMSKVFSVDVPASEVDKFKVQTSTGEVGYNLPPEYAGQAAEVPPPTAGTPTTNGTPSDPGRAGNILLKKYVSPDVQDVIAEAAAHDPNAMEEARRGVVSDATVQELADAAGVSVQKVIDRWKPGDAANAETIHAMRTALATKAQEVVDAQKAIQGGADTTANQLRLQMAIREHQAIQQAVSGVTAEAGRGLRVLRQSVSAALQSNDATQMGNLLKRLGGREWTDELAAKLGQLDTSDPAAVHSFLRDLAKPKGADYVNEWLYNSLLSNPSTHVANMVSNTINALLGPVERLGAAAVDAPLSVLQGRPRGRFFGEAGANGYGLIQGLSEGVRAATYALQHGFTLEDALKGETPRMQAFRGPVGNVINVPSRLLNAADAFMRPIMQRGALNAEIFRQAASEGLKGQALKDRIVELTANVPADLMERAGKMADYQLYRQEPKTIAQGLTKLRGLKVAGVEPLRFVLPFVQVPVNATKYGLERTPLGFLNPDLWTKLAKKDPAAADNIARAGIGSIVAATIASQVATGNLDITGAAPTSPAQRDAFYRQGKLPFSLKIGDKWLSYQRWEPFNHSLTQVAAVVDAIRNGKAGASTSEQAMQAGLTIGQNIESQSFLTGINGLLNALADPERYGAQFASQLETSMLPASAAMRATSNLVDPRQRSPQGAVENVENVIPGLSRNVPSKLNNYGEEQNQAGNPFLPYKFQQANDSPLETELYRLKVQPGSTGKTLRGIDLTRQENADHQRVAGQQVKQMLTQLVADPRYRALNESQKAHALELTITHAKDAAAKQFLTQLVQQQGQAAILQRIQQKKLAALPRAG